jgi:hypothetical protein
MTRIRVPHVIRPNKSGAGPQSWMAFAITTTPVQIAERRWRHDLRTIVAIHWKAERSHNAETVEYRTFDSGTAFCEYATRRLHNKGRMGIVADHLDFAAQVIDLSRVLKSCGYRPTRIILEKGKWQQRWKEGVTHDRDGSRSLLWLDLQNFLPAPIRETAAWLSLPYPRTDNDDGRWISTDDGAKWRATVTLRALQTWIDFCRRFNLGYFSATLAGQAFNAYRHRFMQHEIFVHVHDDVIKIEKEANIGARVEIFFRGRAPKGDYVQLDVTSFYGSVMLGNLFPTKQVGHVRRIGPGKLADLLERYATIARVEIATEVPRFPVRDNGKVIYPVGRFVTTLASPELKDALATGAIARVEECIVYEQAPIFDAFVDFFWDLRQRAMRTDERHVVEIAKRFLTAVYGKFGQRVWLSRLIRDDAIGDDRIWREFDWQDGVEYEYRIIGNRMERAEREMMGRDTLLAIPAHVTSYGRSRLWQLVEKAGRHHVYYLDTDSMIGSRVILHNLGAEFARETLGGLRLVKSSSHLFIRAPKWYILGDTRRRGGVPRNAYEVAWNVFEGEESRSMHYQLLHDNPHVAIVEATRTVGPLQEKLSVHAVGHRVEPFRYGEPPILLPGGAAQFPLPYEIRPSRLP